MRIKSLQIGVVVIGAAVAFSAAAETSPRSERATGIDSNLSSTASTSVTNNGQSLSVIRGKEMKKLDKNQDNAVSKEEAKDDKDWTELFAEMDADGNGMIVASELVILENKAKASASVGPPGDKSDLATPKK